MQYVFTLHASKSGLLEGGVDSHSVIAFAEDRWMKLQHFILGALAALVILANNSAQSSDQGFSIPRSHIHTVYSKETGRDYSIFVKTPRGYNTAQDKERYYPVVYLNDGPYTFQIASGITHTPDYENLYEQIILVGISYASGETGKRSRTWDYTPNASGVWKTVVGPTGGAGEYLTFIENQLIPFVETNYRADPSQRTLAGHSFGGLFATWVLFENPGLFRNFIISSPSLWLNKKAMLHLERRYANEHNDLDATVYFGIGEAEAGMVDDQTQFLENLRSRNFPSLKLRDNIIADIDHTLAFPINFTRAVRWLYRATHQ
ncbi:alpha/beta hydrolase [Labrenzia sp. PHM005]|uniref:alpha/beta hydrolase n=1 Tax=Labrenzia sp. PHM005 TaxID=2590016 RepID=UPI00113FC795|nr:alpha/beta hydrolase-fold protein [Labrenzia sp. PHM005]QDG77804.1 alpha/beta hydrolase [Labrenzia sp. PHM005]